MHENHSLTSREREILKLIGQGHTSNQIAPRLKVSVQTVANHRKHICRKLGLHSTAELVAYAAQGLSVK
jgi:DNA-binding CsgD family transcriptional regulator